MNERRYNNYYKNKYAQAHQYTDVFQIVTKTQGFMTWFFRDYS